MARRPVRGLTLVEVLVLIGIIGMVLLVVVSMMPRSHVAHDRVICMNNQKQLGIAMLHYEGKFHRFPGWKNNLLRTNRTGTGESNLNVNWVIPILPNLERTDIYKNWQNTNIPYATTEPRLAVYLRILTCPSDPPGNTRSTSTPLAYSVNCGLAGTKACDGVFFDLTDTNSPSMSLDYLSQHDGASMTLLLSENINYSGDHKWIYAGDTELTIADAKLRRIGFRWDRGRINEEINKDKPRPSSYHPGGVIATFCDGHVVFLREDISENVFQHLSTPDSAAAGVPGELKDEDY